MRISARCPEQGCGFLYESSEIKGEAHRSNAYAKAVRIAQDHAKATSHSVEVGGDGRVVGVVACRCAKCGKDTPGNPFGECTECLFGRFE